MHLSLFSDELMSFQHDNGTGSWYGQLCRNITSKLDDKAGIEDFLPHNLFGKFQIDPQPTMPAAAAAAALAVRDGLPLPKMPTLA